MPETAFRLIAKKRSEWGNSSSLGKVCAHRNWANLLVYIHVLHTGLIRFFALSMNGALTVMSWILDGTREKRRNILQFMFSLTLCLLCTSNDFSRHERISQKMHFLLKIYETGCLCFKLRLRGVRAKPWQRREINLITNYMEIENYLKFKEKKTCH